VFRIDAGSDVPIYRQLVQQVRREVMLGRLRPGDQLPSVKEVVDALSVNPNTVVKAFTELEHQGLLGPLARWVERARRDGLSAEQIRMLVEVALDEPAAGEDDRLAAGGAA